MSYRGSWNLRHQHRSDWLNAVISFFQIEVLQIQRISAKLDRNDLPSAVRAVFGSDREPFEKKSAGLRGDLRVGVPRNLEQGC